MDVLVTVKAYPALSQRLGEVVCVAGIRLDGQPGEPPEWVRLFPVAFRDMSFTDRFAKYQVISIDVTRPRSDTRPESWTPNLGTLQLGEKLPSAKGWRSRRDVLDRVRPTTMCQLQREQADSGTSLGFAPAVEVEDLLIAPAEEFDEVRAALAAQTGLFGPLKTPLEPTAYAAKYRYRCGEDGCGGHTQGLIDWEFHASARSWRSSYDEPVLREKLREKWLEEMCHPSRATGFFLGNQRMAPKSFLALGVFWPPAGTA